MDSDIENSTKQIKILIRTNIPGKDGFLELTKNMMDVKDKSGMSDYPYFSEKFLYPTRLLNTYTYDQRVDFFFNEKTFKRLIYDNKTVTSCSSMGCKIDDFLISEKDEDGEGDDDDDDDDDYDDDDDDDYDDGDDEGEEPDKTGIDEINIMRCNIETMIRMLFPTTFPAISENIDSFCQYMKKEEQSFITLKNSLPESIADFIIPSLKSSYSYLNIGDAKYTITKTIWLNDFLNHPLYKELVEDFVKIKLWIKTVGDEYGFKNDIISYGKNIKIIINNLKIKKMIKNNEKTLDDTVVFINNNNMSQPTYSNNKEEVLKKFKKNIRDLFGYSNDDAMERVVSFDTPRKSKRRKNTTSIRISGGVAKNNITKTAILENTKNVYKRKFSVERSVELIKTIFKTIEDNPEFAFKDNTPLYDIFKELLEISRKLKKVQDSLVYFVEYPKLSFNTDKKIDETFKSGRFKPYSDYINKLEKYSDTNLKCYNKILQLAINNYVRNIDLYLNKYLDHLGNLLYGKYTEFPGSKDYFPSEIFNNSKFPYFVGITSTGNGIPKYELYLQVKLFKGEITKENVNLLSCNYKNTDLGGMVMENVDNRNTYNPHLVMLEKTLHELPVGVNSNNTTEPSTIGGRRPKPNKTLRKKYKISKKTYKTKKLKHKKHFIKLQYTNK